MFQCSLLPERSLVPEADQPLAEKAYLRNIRILPIRLAQGIKFGVLKYPESIMDSQVEEIKNRVDIVEFISEYLTLRSGGVNFKALCPFHQEKTPSFMVNRERQFWHCFGCNQGGDIFTFLQKIENIEFPEALRILAARAGVELKSFDPRLQSERARLQEANAKAAEFFHTQLFEPGGKEALDYLTKVRKLTLTTIKTWRLGYAPPEWRILLERLTALGFTSRELIASGLVIDSQGRAYDRFRNRIMFPIISLHGYVVGFSARALSNDPNEPKYINTPQTLIYDKGSTLFGLYQARNAIRQQQSAILVEGNMDVIASVQAEVASVVAASGTGLTQGHLNLLSRFTKEIYFCFDVDEAGLRAAERGITLALAGGFFVKVIPLSKEMGKDPADIVEKSPSLWKELVSKGTPFMEYLLLRAKQEGNPEDVQAKKRVFQWLVTWLSRIAEPVEQDFYLKKVVTLLDVDESIVRREIHERTVRSRVPASPKPPPTEPVAKPLDVQLMESLLAFTLQRKHFFDFLVSNCGIELVPEEFVALYKLLVNYYTIHNQITPAGDLGLFLREEHPQHEHSYFSLLARGEEELESLKDDELAFQEVKKLLLRLKKSALEQKRKELVKSIQRSELAGKTDEVTVLVEKFQQLSEQLLKLDE